MIAYLTGGIAIRRILDRLAGLSPSEHEKPPPPIRDVVRTPVDDDGWRIHQAR